ncbi:hypothetical protein GCM10010182_79880 [Actinomadura cremea]|nr:hypothetical protein GCM10010182_79880 [Actinomadura cremea]
MTGTPPDEDVLAIPAAWRRHLHPRRGGAPGPATGPDAAKEVPGLLSEASGALASLLAGRHGDPPRTGAARRHLDGTPDPAGAAVVAAVTAAAVRGERRDRTAVHRAFADHWTAAHGPAFAACAVVELAGTVVLRTEGGPWRDRRLGAGDREGLDVNMHAALRRVRARLAAAGDAEYAEAERRLEAYRRDPLASWLASYLLPTRRDWTAECFASGADLAAEHRRLALCSIGDAALLGDLEDKWIRRNVSREVLVTLLDGVGTAVLPFLRRLLDHWGSGSRDRTAVWATIAAVPCDDAFRTLLDALADRHARAALQDAANRFPVRALRLLAAADAPQARELLADHVRARPDVVEAALPVLPGDVRAAVEPLAAPPDVRKPEKVPGFLTELPWDRPVKPVVRGLEPPADRRFFWKGGGWKAHLVSERIQFPPLMDPDWDDLLRRYHGRMPRDLRTAFLLHAPEDMVRPLLADWRKPQEAAHGGPWPLTLVHRYGPDAFPFAWTQAVESTKGIDGRLLVPFLDAAVAEVMGEWSQRKEGELARDWLDWHGLGTVPYLAPAALGRRARPRRGAEAALRVLAGTHGVEAVAGAFPEAAGELRAVLSAHPLRTGLVPRPKLPAWTDPAVLPKVLLRGRESALPADATRSLVELLASPEPYATGETREGFDPDSLMEFGWALFEKWRSAGEPAKHGWALAQLARTGHDATVGRLVPIIGAWPGTGGHAKAIKGLDVLGDLGTDASLNALRDIARSAKFDGLTGDAWRRFRAAADARGLTPDRLADRLVPGLGLDADASTTLDYGPRRFRIRFDETLRPRVADADGGLLKALPKPGAKDDPDLARAAYRTFGELKKNVQRVASDRRDDLERAMTGGRRWTPAEFRDHLVRHPIVGRIARRLVWLAEPGGSATATATATAFRIAEDGTFADVHDDPFDPFDPPEITRIRLAHPAHLGDELPAWREVFADYELLQPFPQLERPAVHLTGPERDGDRLDRFAGRALHAADVLAARRATRWRDGRFVVEPGEARWAWWPVGDDRRIVVGLGTGPWPDPGGDGDAAMTVEYVRATTLPPAPPARDDPGGDPVRFGELDAGSVSEGLTALFEPL